MRFNLRREALIDFSLVRQLPDARPRKSKKRRLALKARWTTAQQDVG